MLGDVLFEAIQDIEFYQQEYPQLYDQYREEIDSIKSQMDMLRMRIDRPPGGLPVLRA